MRVLGLVLVLLGLVALFVGGATGTTAFFGWNGRHAIVSRPLAEGPSTQEFPVWGGRRYTVGVQVVFDREGLETKDGSVVVEAELPLVLRVKDRGGNVLAQLTGWLDPNKRPNVLYGQAARESVRGPAPELVVERLVGPFATASDTPLVVEVDLGADRVGRTHLLERRLVVFDDVLPPNIRNSFIAAGAGVLMLLGGIALTVVGWFRTRRKPRGT